MIPLFYIAFVDDTTPIVTSDWNDLVKELTDRYGTNDWLRPTMQRPRRTIKTADTYVSIELAEWIG